MSEDDQIETGSPHTTRRTLLQRGAVVGAATLWTTPVIQSITRPAFAQESPPPDPTGSIAGVVSNAQTGDPLAGATVSGFGTATTTTAADGSFVITGVPNGRVGITASLTGFNTQTVSIVVVDGVNPLNFALSVLGV